MYCECFFLYKCVTVTILYYTYVEYTELVCNLKINMSDMIINQPW